MTEFVIAATYVLIPLFVFIPLFAKYIDFKHAAIQAARYQAWEYTVWYDDAGDRDILDNFNSGHSGFRIPEKPLAVTRDESKVRLMSDIGTELDDGVGTSTGSAIPLISDADETLCRRFDVIKEKSLYGRKYLGIERSTFLFDAQGVLRQAWRGVKVAGHAQAVLAAAKGLPKT